MTKIYEALIHASRQRPEVHSEIAVTFAHRPTPFSGMEEEMLKLYQAIEARLPGVERKIIQFIGSRLGEGTSTIAREFSLVSAFRIRKNVLLLDADRFNPCHHLFFPHSRNQGWQESVSRGHDIDSAIYRVEDTNLYIGQSSNTSTFTPEIFNSQSLETFWETLRHRFDITVIDSTPLTKSPDALAIVPRVDGVVLVVEAEKTRWTVVESVKEQIAKMGGNIIGIAFNKRRYHIPQFIYKRLK